MTDQDQIATEEVVVTPADEAVVEVTPAEVTEAEAPATEVVAEAAPEEVAA